MFFVDQPSTANDSLSNRMRALTKQPLLLLLALACSRAVHQGDFSADDVELKLFVAPPSVGIYLDGPSNVANLYGFRPFGDIAGRIEKTRIGKGRWEKPFDVVRLLHSLFSLVRLPVGWTDADENGSTVSMLLEKRLVKDRMREDFQLEIECIHFFAFIWQCMIQSRNLF